jgi:hypothetical protein
MKKSLILIFAVVTASCGQNFNLSEVHDISEDSLWAGNVTYTMERYSEHPCIPGNKLDSNAINYNEWSRQRAGVRNVCFEIWRPGVTDQENSDFWRLLDVQVHLRIGEKDKTEYVKQVDRVGSNRRYAWELSPINDPFIATPALVDVPKPYRIKSVSGTYAMVESEAYYYFTVNGHELKNSQGKVFTLKYEWQATVSEDAKANGLIF